MKVFVEKQNINTESLEENVGTMAQRIKATELKPLTCSISYF
jgi:hypothetical protein